MFAYVTRGNEFFRARDNVLWAHERDGLLVSARSSLPFARRLGVFFYDLDANVPLYYERALPDPPPDRTTRTAPIATPAFARPPELATDDVA